MFVGRRTMENNFIKAKYIYRIRESYLFVYLTKNVICTLKIELNICLGFIVVVDSEK